MATWSWRAAFWRLFMLFMGLLLATAVMLIMTRINQDNSTTLRLQANQLTRLLVEQSAVSVSQLFGDDTEDALQALVNALTQDSAVDDVVVYDSDGNIVAASQHAKPLTERFGDHPAATIGRYLPRVATLFDDGERIGFIRIVLDYPTLMMSTSRENNHAKDILQLAILLAAISGYLLARGSVRYRQPGQRQHHDTTEPTNRSNVNE